MFYEETIVNGVLCHRNTPDGPWERFSIEALSSSFVAERQRAEFLQDKVDNLEAKIEKVKCAIKEAVNA